jgi:hypothetical protein
MGKTRLGNSRFKVGEVLAVESAYSSITFQDAFVHCHECLDLCYNPIPCDKCTQTLYCKDKAFSYHQYECPIFFSLSSSIVDVVRRVVLKTVLVARNEWNNWDADSDRPDEEYRSDRFKEISNLLTHADSRSKDDLLAETSVACQFYYLLKNHTRFLKGGINEDRLKEILLIMVLISKTNIVDINKLSPDLKMETIGNAIYSFCNLFNHSCWPNVRKYFHGNTIVLRAINAIKKGEQCFVNYG